MPLCTACEGIRYEFFFTGGGVPWNRTTSDVELSAKSCDLCALLMSASDPKWEPDKSLYLFGIWTYDDLGDTYAERLRLRQVCFRTHEDGDSSPEDLQTADRFGQWTYVDDGRLHEKFPNALSVYLNIVANWDAPASLLEKTYFRSIGRSDDPGQIQRWLKECKTNHPACAKPHPSHDWTLMPARLVDVGKDGKSPKLISVSGKAKEYLALSYRWGQKSMAVTTRQNFEAQIKGIDFESLCTTIRDALVMTARLGYRYIWIDSLCIIQDSPDDWAAESTRMATIYMNATLTLAATCATSGDTRLFHARHSGVRMECRGPGSDDKTASSNQFYFLEEPKTKGFDVEVVNGPLASRGWCLQERYLSRRTVHFGRTQLFWECQSALIEEYGPRNTPYLYYGYLKALSSSAWDAKGMSVVRGHMERSQFTDWYRIVADYTQRGLTNPDDKLPAISGLASIFGSYRDDTYLAGLWKRDIQTGLLWSAADGERLEMPSTFRAPSWSWASRDGPVLVEHAWDGEMDLKVIESSTTLAGDDPYGRVLDGFIKASGLIIKIPKISPMVAGESQFVWASANTQMLNLQDQNIGEGCLDNPQSFSNVDQLFCLLVIRVKIGFRPISPMVLEARGDIAWGLLLECTGTKYRRVGLAQVRQAYFEGVSREVVIIE